MHPITNYPELIAETEKRLIDLEETIKTNQLILARLELTFDKKVLNNKGLKNDLERKVYRAELQNDSEEYQLVSESLRKDTYTKKLVAVELSQLKNEFQILLREPAPRVDINTLLRTPFMTSTQ